MVEITLISRKRQSRKVRRTVIWMPNLVLFMMLIWLRGAVSALIWSAISCSLCSKTLIVSYKSPCPFTSLGSIWRIRIYLLYRLIPHKCWCPTELSMECLQDIGWYKSMHLAGKKITFSMEILASVKNLPCVSDYQFTHYYYRLLIISTVQ